MKIQSSKASDAAAAADMDDEGGEGAAALLASKGRVVTQVAKKNLVQHAIPIFIELKRLLEGKNSPLIGSLMDCLRVILKDYRNEIEEILVADKQLRKELIYDMEKYDAAKAKSVVSEAMAHAKQQHQAFSSPAAVLAKLSEKLGSHGKIGSAVANAAAAITAKSVLREANRSGGGLQSKIAPMIRTGGDRIPADPQKAHVLDSLRRRQMFEFDEED